MCKAVSCQWRRAGADSVPPRPRISSDYRALPGMQAESRGAGERPVWMSLLQKTRFTLRPVGASRRLLPAWRLPRHNRLKGSPTGRISDLNGEIVVQDKAIRGIHNPAAANARVATGQWPHLSGITKLRKIFQLPSAWFCHTVKYLSTRLLPPSNVASARPHS